MSSTRWFGAGAGMVHAAACRGLLSEPGPDWWEGEHLRYTASSGNLAV